MAEIRVTVYYARSFGWALGTRLNEGVYRRVPVEPRLELTAPTWEGDAELVFQALGNNYHAEKPMGFRDRSACVGDVFEIHYATDACWVTVEGLGFRLLTPEEITTIKAAPVRDFETEAAYT